MTKKENKMANLVPLNKRSKDEVQAITSKGGVASGETRRRMKKIKDIMNVVDRQQLPKDIALSMEKLFSVKDATVREGVILTIYKEALAGNLKAIELYLRLKDEMPRDISLKADDKSLTIIWNENRYETDEETE